MPAASPSSGVDLARRLDAHLDQLPVLPQAIARLLALDPDDDSYFDDVVTLLESEPNFAARLFRAANSAASYPQDPVSTIKGAVARIGSTGATNLVLALSVTTVFVPRDPWEQSLWRHGVQVAHAARALARLASEPGVDPETLYATGLLHDVGRFVMFQVAPSELRLVDEGDWDAPETLIEQERAICGLTHAEIGAMACTKWGLPEVVVTAVRRHHEPLRGPVVDPIMKAVALTRLADLAMFPSAVPGTPALHEELDDDEIEAHLAPAMPEFLHTTGPVLSDLVRTASRDADDACRALGLTL